jgi:hypothetical protein
VSSSALGDAVTESDLEPEPRDRPLAAASPLWHGVLDREADRRTMRVQLCPRVEPAVARGTWAESRSCRPRRRALRPPIASRRSPRPRRRVQPLRDLGVMQPLSGIQHDPGSLNLLPWQLLRSRDPNQLQALLVNQLDPVPGWTRHRCITSPRPRRFLQSFRRVLTDQCTSRSPAQPPPRCLGKFGQFVWHFSPPPEEVAKIRPELALDAEPLHK